MKRAITLVKLSLFLTLLLIVPAQAQRRLDSNGRGATCGGPIFSSREVSRRARITSRKIPDMTPEALAHNLRGRVKLEAVFCRTGRVTDVRVLEGLPFGMTAKVIESVLTISFEPAELNWHTVSEKMGFEFDFNGGSGGSEEIAIERVAGRLIDSIEIVGYRRHTEEQILKWIITRPGDVCSGAQLQRDLEAILKTGYFDKKRTRVFAEEGTQGRLVIVFETFELP